MKLRHQVWVCDDCFVYIEHNQRPVGRMDFVKRYEAFLADYSTTSRYVLPLYDEPERSMGGCCDCCRIKQVGRRAKIGIYSE